MNTKKSFSHPKWTDTHMITQVIYPYIVVSDEMIGSDNTDKILNSLDVHRSHFANHSNWLSTSFLDTFLDEFSNYGDIRELNAKAGIKMWDKQLLGPNFYALRYLLSPRAALKIFERNVRNVNKTRTFKIKNLTMSGARIIVGVTNRDILPKHPETADNWMVGIKTFLELVTGFPAKITRIQSCYDGHDACIYDAKWTPASTLKNIGYFALISTLNIAAILLFTYNSSMRHYTTIVPSAVIFAALSAYAIKMRKDRLNLSEFIDKLQEVEEDGEKKYKELQEAKTNLDKRYQEEKIIEEAARNIQKNDSTTNILNSSLEAICNNFSFDRAFVMLKDDEEQKLETVALKGIKEQSEMIWNFRVDISKKSANEFVLSNVYHSGVPLIVNDIEVHFRHLSDVSINLIKAINSKGFIIVPIIGESDSNLGVLAADRMEGKLSLDASDLKLLQRIAQHISIALTKQIQIDREKNLRTIFQKYAPSDVIDNAMNNKDLIIEGVKKTVTCMFLDICDFTIFAEKYPAKVVVGVLNRTWTMVYDIISSYGGFLDKYIGDGVMITWGAVKNSKNDPAMAVDAALRILRDLKVLNSSLKEEGIEALSMRIGINTGEAIVGNIGAKDRLEYTAIGDPINKSSRLQELCKKYSTTLMVSEAVYRHLTDINKHKFVILKSVTLRKSNQALDIAYLKLLGDKDDGTDHEQYKRIAG